jgi:CheY-like chemotaxis protein
MKSAAIPSASDPFITGSLVPNILVVDDDAAIRNMLVGLYESIGYTVIAVRSGEEAICILEPETIDFVITDINLP